MRKIGYTTGVFDMFHVGHLNILRRAKLECDHLIVGVTTDELCLSRKKKNPIIPFYERIQIVENIKYVDEVVPQENMDKMEAWRNLKFDRMFVGGDWKGTEQWNQIEKEFNSQGVEIVYFPYTEHTSSTKLRLVLDSIIESIAGNDVL
jgi:glycerol-3-phosphate cytidylyltransferase